LKEEVIMTFLWNIKKKLNFDDYMVPFLILFGFLYLMGAIKFLSILTSFYGTVIYIAHIVGGGITIFLFLKVFQVFCRLVGVDKLYNNIRKKD
jgi:hypothetical protein